MRTLVSGCALVLLLVLPASASLPSVEWNLHLWRRLWTEHKTVPESARDTYVRQFVPLLPDSGRIGLVYSGPIGEEERVRTRYLLQYSLAPRVLVESSDPPFVIVVGARSPRALEQDSRFVLVRSPDDGLSLFRRIDR